MDRVEEYESVRACVCVCLYISASISVFVSTEFTQCYLAPPGLLSLAPSLFVPFDDENSASHYPSCVTFDQSPSM